MLGLDFSYFDLEVLRKFVLGGLLFSVQLTITATIGGVIFGTVLGGVLVSPDYEGSNDYVFSPAGGAIVEVDGRTLTVTELDGRRASRIRVTLRRTGDGDTESVQADQVAQRQRSDGVVAAEAHGVVDLLRRRLRVVLRPRAVAAVFLDGKL